MTTTTSPTTWEFWLENGSPEPLADWLVTDAEDKALKEAFQAFYQGPGKGMVVVPQVNADGSPSTQTKKQFILKSRGYYDIQAYIYTALRFPKDTAGFQASLPKSAFSKLTAIDPNIYDTTQRTVIEIRTSCDAFNRDGMGEMLLVSKETRAYCKNAIDLLTFYEESSLKGQLQVLLDPKYETNQTAQEFKDAKEGVTALLDELKKDADNNMAKVDSVVKKIASFQLETISNKARVDFLRKQYQTGPVVKGEDSTEPKLGADGKPQAPYAVWLQAELAQLRQQILDETKERDQEYENWKYNTTVASTAVTYIWIPAIGATVMGVYGDRAVKSRARYDQLKTEIEGKEADQASFTKLVELVTGLTHQFDNIETKIQKALEALGEVRQLFLTQSQNFADVSKKLGMASSNVPKALYFRKSFIQKSIDFAVVGLKYIDQLAEEFQLTTIEYK